MLPSADKAPVPKPTADSVTPSKKPSSNSPTSAVNKQYDSSRGSYRGYYQRRNHNEKDKADVRLPYLYRSIADIPGELTVLDVGCNVGTVTAEIARMNNVKKMVGIDIDKGLISKAKRAMKEQRKRWKTAKCSLEFRREDFAREEGGKTANEEGVYDVILCLSVTKWVHLNSGDEGLMRLFERMYACLRPNGMLLLEPQGKKSYKRARKMVKGGAEKTFGRGGLQMKPEMFQDILCSKVGFTRSEVIKQVSNKRGETWNRPIIAFFKDSSVTTEKSQGPEASKSESTVPDLPAVNVDQTKDEASTGKQKTGADVGKSTDKIETRRNEHISDQTRKRKRENGPTPNEEKFPSPKKSKLHS